MRTPERVNLRGEVKTLGGPKASVRVTLVEHEGPQPHPLVKQKHQRRHLRVSSRVKN